MADPITLFFVAASTVASIAGGVEDIKQAKYQERVANENADAAKHEGSAIAELEAAKGRADVGHARALAAASGLSVDGSAAGVIGSLAAVGEYNARSAIYQGRRRVAQFDADARTAKHAQKAALIRTIGQVSSTLLTAGMGGSPAASSTAGGGTSLGRSALTGGR